MASGVFVLFLWFWPGSSAGVSFVAEFDGEQSCHAAAKGAMEKIAGPSGPRYICVPKKITP